MKAVRRLVAGLMAVVGPSAVVLGVCLVAAGPVRAAVADRPAPPPPATVAAVLATWLTDHLYLAPDVSARPDDAQQRQLRADAASAPDPLYVAVLGRLPHGYTSTKAVAAALGDRLPGHTWVVVYADATLPAIGGSYADDDHAEDFVYAIGAVDQDQGTPVERLLALTGRLGGRLPTDIPFGPGSSLDSGGGESDHPALRHRPATGRVVAARIAIGLLALGLLVALLVGLVRLVGRHGASDVRTWRLGRRVARGDLADRRIRARRAVLDLGGRLESLELAPGDDRDAWQAALDSYDRAGRLLDRIGDAGTATDYRDVIDLCESGRAQLDRARAAGRA